jgi:hypothetical protein
MTYKLDLGQVASWGAMYIQGGFGLMGAAESGDTSMYLTAPGEKNPTDGTSLPEEHKNDVSSKMDSTCKQPKLVEFNPPEADRTFSETYSDNPSTYGLSMLDSTYGWITKTTHVNLSGNIDLNMRFPPQTISAVVT